MEILDRPRSKAFVSMDSLWYEEERLATFIDWPVPFISPRELAQEGFYYLRTKDHCACAFCRGIIGAWEEGDTPRGEHKRHFPHCPFVQGKVTQNVPIAQGNILARVSREVTSDTGGRSSKSQDVCKFSESEDICGHSKKEKLDHFSEGRIVTKNSNSEISVQSLGIRQYCGPKRKEYLTQEIRLKSFKKWPEKLKQTPESLAEAGFYYCGLSDHVRCFHCGNGLRNWEPEDTPWEEHARWFPDCHFVLLQKGIEFVDKVRRENPPYIAVRSKSSNGASGNKPYELSEDELGKLMELQIMKHVLEMGFSEVVVRKALMKRLHESGQPFFSVEACIDAVLSVMEEETKSTIHGCEDITSQARKMTEYAQSVTVSQGANAQTSQSESRPSSSGVNENISAEALSPPSDNDSGTESLESALPPLPNNNVVAAAASPPSDPLPPLPNISRASPPLRSSTPTSQLGSNLSHSVEMESSNEAMESSSSSSVVRGDSLLSSGSIDSNASSESEEEVTEVASSPPSGNDREANVQRMELPRDVAPLISEADDIMEEAAKLLNTSSSSSASSSQPSSLSSLGSNSSSQGSSSSSSSSQPSSSSASSSSSSSSSPSQTTSSSAHASSSSVVSNPSDSSTSTPSPQRNDSQRSLVSAASTRHESEVPCKVSKIGDPKNESLVMELERIRENRMCKVCMDKEMDVVFLPCTHMVTCSTCAVALAECPICRREIKYAFKPIIS